MRPEGSTAAARFVPAAVSTEPRVDRPTLVASHAERVHRFAAMLTNNAQDSQDLAQEALVRALRSLTNFDPEKGTLEAWLWRIVINCAKDAGRLSTRRGLLRERWLSQQQTAAAGSVEADALARLRDADVLAAVRRLPRRPRTIIALRFGAHLSIAEIAQQLGTTPGAVSMAIGRALGSLRRDLEDTL